MSSTSSNTKTAEEPTPSAEPKDKADENTGVQNASGGEEEKVVEDDSTNEGTAILPLEIEVSDKEKATKTEKVGLYASGALLQWAGVCVWASFGVTLRIFMSFIPAEDGSFIAMFGKSYLLQNILGSFILGALTSLTTNMSTSNKFHLSPAVTTGFCGSLTTWSSWQQAIAVKFVSNKVADGLLNYSLGHALFYIAFRGGIHVAETISACKTTGDAKEDKPVKGSMLEKFTFALCLSVYILLIILIIIAGQEYRHMYFGAFFGGAGAMLRYVLGKFNKSGQIPLFTLLANVLGSIFVACVTRSLYHASLAGNPFLPGTGNWAVDIGVGGILGFGGALTTVSSYIGEIHNLPRGQMYLYAVLSFFSTQLFMVIINSL